MRLPIDEEEDQVVQQYSIAIQGSIGVGWSGWELVGVQGCEGSVILHRICIENSLKTS